MNNKKLNLRQWFVLAVLISLTLGLNVAPTEQGKQPTSPQGTPLAGVAPALNAPSLEFVTPERRDELIREVMQNLWQYVPQPGGRNGQRRQVTAENGQIAYVNAEGHLALMNPDSSGQISLVTDLTNLADPAWSPGDEYLAFVGDGEGGRCVYKLRISDRNRTTLACGFDNAWEPRWSTELSYLAFFGTQNSGDPFGAWAVPAGGGSVIELAPSLLTIWSPDWKDDDTVLLAGEEAGDIWHIYQVGVGTPDEPDPITPDIACSSACPCTPESVLAVYPGLSPDGTDVAYLGARTEGDKYSCTAYYGVYLVDPEGNSTPRFIADVADSSGSGVASGGTMRWGPDDVLVGVLAGGSDGVLRLNTVDTNSYAVTTLHGREGGSWNRWGWSPDGTLMVAGFIPLTGEAEVDTADPHPPYTFTTLTQGGAPAWSARPSTEPVDLEVTNLEVTQAIQRQNGAMIPLIQDKQTWVRVYIRSASQDVQNVNASLHLSRDNEQIEIVPANGQISAREDGSDRGQSDHTFNFSLPPDWLQGTIGIRAEVNPDRTIYEENFTNNFYPPESEPAQSWTFQQAQGAQIWSYRFRFQGQGIDYQVSESEVAETIAWVNRTYPVPESSITLITPDGDEILVPWSSGGTYDLTDESGWQNLLGLLADKCQPGDRCYGWVPGEVPHGYWGYFTGRNMAGLAGLLQGNGETYPPGSAYGNIAAQELAHTYGRDHAPGCGAADPDPNFPNQGLIGNDDEYGFWGNETEQRVYRPTGHYDFMSYCGLHSQWVSPYTYEALMNNFAFEQTAFESEQNPQDNQLYLIVSGIIASDGVVTFFPFYQRELPVGSDDLTGEGEYRLELQDATGQPLFTRFLTGGMSEIGLPAQQVFFHETMPLPVGVERVVLWDDTVWLGEVMPTPATPQVDITTSLDGLLLQDPLEVLWTAEDADIDVLHYLVEYSADGGMTWSVIGADLTEPRITLEPEQLRGTTLGVIRVLATDGFNTGNNLSNGFFTVPSKPPTALITSPQDSARILPGVVINLVGLAYDREDMVLTADSLIWQLDGNSLVGTGVLASVEQLSYGPHTITLTVTDSDGQSTVASVDIVITDYPQQTFLPVVIKRDS